MKEFFTAPAAPESWDGTKGVTQWGMLGNDDHSNCVVEGTEIQASRAHTGYRARYSGPVVRLTTASGERLTVTPNHAVLTPRGFALARFLQKGDHVVRARFAEGADRAADFDFDHAPTRIEEVLPTLGVVLGAALVPGADDFHGDGRYMDGDVDVVFADRLLDRQPDTTLQEADSQEEVVAAGDLARSLQSHGTAFQTEKVGRTPALAGVRRGGDGAAFLGGHSGVHESQVFGDRARLDSLLDEKAPKPLVGDAELFGDPPRRAAVLVEGDRLLDVPVGEQGTGRPVGPEPLGFPPRSKGYASLAQPSAQGGRTDAELVRELTQRFPVEVSLGELVDVDWEFYEGHVYDLGTEANWYAAGGILVHNCGAALFEHGRMAKALVGANADGTPIFAPGFVPPTRDSTLKLYFDYGVAMGEGPPGSTPDNGVENSTWFPWLLKETGVEGDDDEVACAELDANDENEVKFWMSVGCGVGIGCSLTDGAQAEFANGQPWTISAQEQPDPSLGHDVYAIAYDPNGLVVITWGSPQRCTVAWETGEAGAGDLEVWAFLTRADAHRAGMTDEQFDALLAMCRQIGGEVAPNAVVTPPPPGPGPTPTVQPPPAAPETVADELEEFAAAAHAFVDKLVTAARRFSP